MDAYLYAVIFILGPGVCGGCDVTQTPTILPAFHNDRLKIHCSIRFVNGEQKVTSYIYRSRERQTHLDPQNMTLHNNTHRNVTHTITVRQTDTYYCNATCNTKTSNGTHIYVRGSGYTPPLPPSYKLQCGLIVLTVLLVLLSSVGTYLVVPFLLKKQEKPLTRPKGAAATPGATSHPSTQQQVRESSLYTSLQIQSDDVYDVLEEEPPKHSSLTHRAEVHNVTTDSPVKRPKPQIKPARGKPQAIPDNPPTRQKPRKGESNLYENLTR